MLFQKLSLSSHFAYRVHSGYKSKSVYLGCIEVFEIFWLRYDHQVGLNAPTATEIGDDNGVD